MLRHTLLLLPILFAACSPNQAARGIESPVAPKALSAGDIPAEIGRYRLTAVDSVKSYPADTLYRFTDGTDAVVSAIRYPIPGDVKVGVDSQTWLAREGDKLSQVQEIRVERRQIESYQVAFSTTKPLQDSPLVERATAIAVRQGGAVHMEFQYLYIVGGRFLKVRGTLPGDMWRTSDFPNFARELARRVHRASP